MSSDPPVIKPVVVIVEEVVDVAESARDRTGVECADSGDVRCGVECRLEERLEVGQGNLLHGAVVVDDETVCINQNVVDEADVSPSRMFTSAVVAVTPSRMLSSAAVDVTPSRMLSSAAE